MSLTLFSFNHFSRSCLRPCCRTGRANSNDSCWLSSPFSNNIPKYWRIGDRPPGGEGACLNDSITCAVRRIPWSNVVSLEESAQKRKSTDPGRVRSNLGSLSILTTLEKLLVLLDV